MKRYLSKLIWKPIAVVAAAAILICFIILPLNWALLSLVVILACCCGYFCLNRYCQKLFKTTAPSSYFQDLTQRNVDAIVIGSTVAWKCADLENKGYYDATGFQRSNIMNFHMLRTYFSHVKKNGTVFYVVDPVESVKIGEYISPNDFCHIHPHVFLKLGISYDVVRQTNPLVFDRPFALKLLCSYIQKKIQKNCRWQASRTAAELKADAVADVNNHLRTVTDFCRDRDLVVKVIFVDRGEQVSRNLEQLCAGLEGIQFVRVENEKELNAALVMNQ